MSYTALRGNHVFTDFTVTKWKMPDYEKEQIDQPSHTISLAGKIALFSCDNGELAAVIHQQDLSFILYRNQHIYSNV